MPSCLVGRHWNTVSQEAFRKYRKKGAVVFSCRGRWGNVGPVIPRPFRLLPAAAELWGLSAKQLVPAPACPLGLAAPKSPPEPGAERPFLGAATPRFILLQPGDFSAGSPVPGPLLPVACGTGVPISSACFVILLSSLFSQVSFSLLFLFTCFSFSFAVCFCSLALGKTAYLLLFSSYFHLC